MQKHKTIDKTCDKWIENKCKGPCSSCPIADLTPGYKKGEIIKTLTWLDSLSKKEKFEMVGIKLLP